MLSLALLASVGPWLVPDKSAGPALLWPPALTRANRLGGIPGVGSTPANVRGPDSRFRFRSPPLSNIPGGRPYAGPG